MKITPDVVDRWRVIPRILVTLYGFACLYVAHWFMSLPDPSTQQTSFATAIWSAAAVWFGFYVNSGCDKE